MIRLPVTSIDISLDDLDFHLRQLDIYQGLLEQGFRKKDVIKYFKGKDAESEASGRYKADREPIPSTYELYTVPSLHHASDADDSQPSVSSSNVAADKCQDQKPSASHKIEAIKAVTRKSLGRHTPKQSSLLRFARAVSSEASSENERTVEIPLSPQSYPTHLPRSQTYSYGQSELEMKDTDNERRPLPELEQLSLHDEFVPASTDSPRATIRVLSNLRPEAQAFTPLQPQSMREKKEGSSEAQDASPISSDDRSFSSSPPMLRSYLSDGTRARSPSLPPAPETPRGQHFEQSLASHRRANEAFLDGSFTVYDDSVPPEHQPQTPGDLQRPTYFDEHNAAYTAPPGALRPPVPLQQRHVSGDLNPTARAMVMRERRHREYTRSARFERLRIGRLRASTANALNDGTYGRMGADFDATNDLWWDDLGADGMEEENFNDGMNPGSTEHFR